MDEQNDGFVFRIPRAMLPVVNELSEQTGIPRSVLIKILLEQGMDNPPKWMQDLLGKRTLRPTEAVSV